MSHDAVHVLDDHYLAITLLITLGWQALGFAIAFGLQIDTITDFWSAFNFLALAVITFGLGGAYVARNIVVLVFVILWAVRLGAWQLFRMLKMGGDTRFDEMRSKFWSFAQFWIAQMLWVWVVSLPVILLNSPRVSSPPDGGYRPSFGTATDIIGVILWAIGIFWETSADLSKYRFKAVKKPPFGSICDSGVWKFSRRPNYFGEILHWIGIFLICLSSGISKNSSNDSKASMIGSIVSPLFTIVLLLFLSGIPLAEKPSQKKFYLMTYGPDGGKVLEPFGNDQREEDPWRRMKNFRNRTSLLIPLPNSIYKNLPGWIKSTLLLDFPFYNFNETKEGEAAIKEAEDKQRDQSA